MELNSFLGLLTIYKLRNPYPGLAMSQVPPPKLNSFSTVELETIDW